MVMFGYSGDFQKVWSVYYMKDGQVAVRRLMDDGATQNQDLGYADIPSAYYDMNSTMNPLYVADVDDERSAFKYLGKSSDLIHLLPEADLGTPDQQETPG